MSTFLDIERLATEHGVSASAGTVTAEDGNLDTAAGHNRPWYKRLFSAAETGLDFKVRRLSQFKRGYLNLAAFVSSDGDFAIYRTFGYLQARLLLDKQDQLRLLEEQLDQYDKADPLKSTRKGLMPEQFTRRAKLLGEIETVFTSYASLIQSSQALMSSNRPSTHEIRSVYNYFTDVHPVHDDEQGYIRWKDDLITLRQGRDHAWLGTGIERCLQVMQKRVLYIENIFASRTDRVRADHDDDRRMYFSWARLNTCASLIVLVVIIALLVIPVYITNGAAKVRTKDEERLSDRDGDVPYVAVLLIFTLVFAAMLALLTKAKRHEIVGASAAYCALLVAISDKLSF